ncbi:MAG: Dabb family protein [Actinomycetota bacterium]|nr:Dabb family protein [Actinomycetota bacterium]MDQ2957883.1 Dabb family protein [Actinomycetota bacterium]
MITRTVLLKAHRRDLIRSTLAEMAELPARVDCIESVTVSADRSARSLGYDLMMVLRFRTEDELARWQVHPEHVPFRDILTDPSIVELLVFESSDQAS